LSTPFHGISGSNWLDGVFALDVPQSSIVDTVRSVIIIKCWLQFCDYKKDE
jgi:hypothetical protein